MKGLHLKKNPGGVYPVLLYIGDFFVPLEKELVEELKKFLDATPETFFRQITEKVGTNLYLKQSIQEVIDQSNDRIAQSRTLQSELQST